MTRQWSQKKIQDIDPRLRAVVALRAVKLGQNFVENDDERQPWVSSIPERQLLKLMSDHEAFAKHNRLRLTRVYPDVTRVDSSNLDPLAAWTAGLHFVALNYQTFDRPMRLNRAHFFGNYGYVLKSQEPKPITFTVDLNCARSHTPRKVRKGRQFFSWSWKKKRQKRVTCGARLLEKSLETSPPARLFGHEALVFDVSDAHCAFLEIGELDDNAEFKASAIVSLRDLRCNNFHSLQLEVLAPDALVDAVLCRFQQQATHIASKAGGFNATRKSRLAWLATNASASMKRKLGASSSSS